MPERFKSPLAVFIIMQKGGAIWLQRRANSGFRDGEYDLPSGHVEAGESFTEAAMREAKEEAGVTITRDSLIARHILHNNIDSSYVDVFFEVKEWRGEPFNAEPDRCDDARWFQIDNLPENLVPHVRFALEHIERGVFYGETGWDQ